MTTLTAETNRRIRANGRAVYRGAAAGIRPDPSELVSEWAERYRIVPEMSALPGPWRNSVAPYLIEPMDALSPDDPVPEVNLKKPSQSGGSAVAENWLGFIMHRAAGPVMYVQATIAAARDWVQEKLNPTIAATPVLAPAKGGVVSPQKSRSGEGTTANRIRFRGGFILLAGANSAASLRQHSIRYMVRDDFSAWTANADNEGNPYDLSEARLKTYKVFGLSKTLNVSSPKFKGADIDARYEQSDRRRYYMACKGCGALTDFDWEDVQRAEAPPYRSHLVCPACGVSHYEGDKHAMLSAANGACWIPTAPDADGVVPPKTISASEREMWRTRVVPRFTRGYDITGVMNVFETWDGIAAQEDDAGDDPEKRQPFENTVLGRAYAPKGEGPSWEILAARRESEWERGVAPAGVLYTTMTVDVQGDGLYWAALGWGPNKENWHIDHGFLPGTTDVAFEGAWPKLDLVVDHGMNFAGVRILADLIGVDSGYNSEAVYSWVKRRHNALALKGMDGWSKLPIYKSETPEVKKRGLSAGKARRYGMKVWLVGTYGLKAALMVYLGRTAKEGEGSGLPSGYQHFPRNAEDDYFRHLSSEYIQAETDPRTGETRRVWMQRGPNHWLDCVVYGWALTHFAGLWAWDEVRWEQRAQELRDMLKLDQPDMFAPATAAAVAVRPLQNDVPAQPVKPAASQDDGLAALSKLNR